MENDDRLAPNMRPFLILEVLSLSESAMTASEIHRALDLPKQTVHRLCNAMEAQGILAREPGTRRLRPGRRARVLASGILSTAHAPIARHQILADVARAAGETVNLVVAQERGMFYVDRVETNWVFRVQLPIGTHVPFHCTASGKTFLASCSPAERRRLVGALTLERLTENTITDAEALLAQLERIAAQGYALDDEEFFLNMSAIAVPVRDTAGRFYAAIAIHGPTQRFPIEAALEHHDTLKQAAKRISALLF